MPQICSAALFYFLEAMNVVRGTTAEFKFNIPCDFENLHAVKITFWQHHYNGTTDKPLPIIKSKVNCTTKTDPKEVYVSLTQEETLRFRDDRKGYVQFKASSVDGLVFGSKEEAFMIYPSYDDSLIEEDPLPTPTEDVLILDGGEINL